MDGYNAIRAGIFLIGGLVSILFHKQLNNLKNRVLEKLNFKSRDERKGYFITGIIFILIAIVLFVYALVN